MLVGLFGVAVPVIIHLIGKERAQKVRFAALDFLLGQDEVLARRLRIEDRALLLARVLVCLAIALVLAKPYAGCGGQAVQMAAGPQTVVLIIDDSMPSGANLSGSPIFEQIRAKANDLLLELDPQAQVAVLFTASDSSSLSTPTADRGRLQHVIASKKPTHLPGRLQPALLRAAGILQASQEQTRTCYLLSPLARGNGPAELTWSEDSGHLVVLDVKEGKSLENASIDSVETQGDPDSGGIRLLVRISAYGASPQTRTITVRTAESVIARGQVTVDAGASVVEEFSIRLPEEQRRGALSIELSPDALIADDTYYLLLDRRADVEALLVNGAPSTTKRLDELFYLRSALRPGDRRDSGIRWTEIVAPALTDQKLGTYDVIFLANVAALDPALVTRLLDWVHSGGGLFISMGTQVDPDAYNSIMRPLLPQELASVVDASYGASAEGQQRRAWRLGNLDYAHPILSIFPKNPQGLVAAEFEKVMLLGPTTDTTERHIVAQFDSGATAIALSRAQKGLLLLFTSSLDRDWNDLALHPGYLPLLQQATRFLAGRSARDARRHYTIGETVLLPIRKQDDFLIVDAPNERSQTLDAQASRGKGNLSFSNTLALGFYRVSARGRTGDPQGRPTLDFAINTAPSASDTSVVVIVNESDASADGAQIRSARKTELWHALACLLLLVLLIESVLVLRRSQGGIRRT